MRILVLIVLAVVAYLLYKAFIAKNPSGKPALEDDSTPVDGSASSSGSAAGAGDSAARVMTDIGSGSTAAATAANSTASSAASAVAGTAGEAIKSAVGSAVPNTGDPVSDIQELFKILNLRSSDAPRLGISTEQYDSLKNGEAGSMDSELLDNVMDRLKSMLQPA